jgi:hypothetical protein
VLGGEQRCNHGLVISPIEQRRTSDERNPHAPEHTNHDATFSPAMSGSVILDRLC